MSGMAVWLCLNCFSGHPALAAAETSGSERFSLQTEFWRTEFQQLKTEPIGADGGTESAEFPRKANDSGFELLMSLMTEEQSQIMENEALRVVEDPMSTQADMVSGSVPSDWDRAAMNTASTKSLHASGNTGPSTVTMAVAVIGMIVLAGAYLRS